MQKDIHPAYDTVTVNCSCGHQFSVKSTAKRDLHLEICAKCHPFYTGTQKLMDTAGRVDRFNKRYAKRGAANSDKDENTK